MRLFSILTMKLRGRTECEDKSNEIINKNGRRVGLEPQTSAVSRPSLGHLGQRAIFAHALNISQCGLRSQLNTAD